MKKVIFTVFFYALAHSAFSQTTDTIPPPPNWTRGGFVDLKFSDTHFTNWAAGGDNALNINSAFNAFSNYKKDKLTWDNKIDLAYGLVKLGSQKGFRKSDDRLDFTSKAGYKASQFWYYSAMFNFKSFVAPGYNYVNDSTKKLISKFLSPAWAEFNIGMDYKPIPEFSLFVSPIANRLIMVLDDSLAKAGVGGIKEKLNANGQVVGNSDHFRYEFGATVKANYNKKNIIKNVDLNTSLGLFSNYLDQPENVDIFWDVLIAMKVNKLISASVASSLIYDQNVPIPVYEEIAGVKTKVGEGPRTQFRRIIGVGFNYKF